MVHNENNQNNQFTKGGKVIASGGFGCVFKPALRCLGNRRREKNKISKLMTEKYALEEFNEIKTLKFYLYNVPYYQDYFIIDNITLCKPAKLFKKDLKNFKTCTALPKDNITRKNINRSLNKLLSLNIPNGGLPVDDYIYKYNSFEKFKELNNSLMNLLLNGILPMNQKNVYHCDIKDSNVLVDNSKIPIKTRLIDWGLSIKYKPESESIPRTFKNRSFQYNVPFSVILFSDYFLSLIHI